MGRVPCCEENSGVKKGPWTEEEDEKLKEYIKKHGHGSWRTLPKKAGLNRCGKSCRLRWTNYLRPDIKRGKFSQDEDRIIINLHSVLGNKWSKIAGHLPGRTDNEIKNYWNTHIRKKLLQMGIDPETHKPRTDFNYLFNNLSHFLNGISSSSSNNLGSLLWGNMASSSSSQLDLTSQLTKIQLLQNLLLQTLNSNPNSLLANNNSSNQTLNLLQVQSFMNGTNNGVQFPQGGSGLEGFGLNNMNGGNSIYNNIIPHFPQSQNHQLEMTIPALVSASSSPVTGSAVKRTDGSSCDTAPAGSTDELPNNGSAILFERWEKFLDDEMMTGSDWKDILELSSTLASSPISL